MIERRRYGMLALGMYLLVYLLPLGGRPLFVPDETRYAEIPREMLATGDFVVPRLDGLRYFEKPVLGYWVHAASLAVFGENRFAVRFPSALAVGLTALVIVVLLRRTLPRPGDEALPGLAALVFITSFEVFGVGTFAVLDSLLSLFLTIGIVALFFAGEARPASGRERKFLAWAGAAFGLAFLTKGFLALAVPACAFGPYLAWEGRWRDMPRMAWPVLLAAAVVALPWSLAVAAREPGFWHYFFWVEHVKRFLARDAQHGEPFWYYLACAPGAFLPWSFVLPAAVVGLRRSPPADGREARLRRFALAWLVGPFVFFSAAHGKIVTYILPCFPPAAVLCGLGLWRDGGKPWFARGGWSLAGGVAVLAAALAWLRLHPMGTGPGYGRWWQWAAAFAALAWFALAALLAGRRGDAAGRMAMLAAAPGLLFVLAPVLVPGAVLAGKAPMAFLARHRAEVPAGTILVSGEEPLTAVCFLFGRDDVRILGNPGELAYGLSFPDAASRHLDPARTAELIRANPGRVALAARLRNYRRWQRDLPPPRTLDTSGPRGYVFATY